MRHSVLSEAGGGISVTHIVFQALNDLNAIVAQIELSQVDEVLQTLDFSNPVTLEVKEHQISNTFKFQPCSHSDRRHRRLVCGYLNA